MFQFYPKIYYKVNNHDYLRITDLSVNTRVKQFVNLYRQTSLRPYVIKDGESPDLVSYKIYGSSKYDYIILMTNDITNYYDEWPKSYKVLTDYIEKKYGSLNYAKNNYAKYYTADGDEISQAAWIEQSPSNQLYYRVTHYDYEFILNDKKSQIQILNPALVIKFEVELQQLMSNIQQTEAV